MNKQILSLSQLIYTRLYDADVAEAKKKLRNAEQKYLTSRRSEDLQEYRRLRQKKCHLVTEKETLYYQKRIEDCDSDTSKLYKVVNKLSGKHVKNKKLPEEPNHIVSAEKFKELFITKVQTITSSFST